MPASIRTPRVCMLPSPKLSPGMRLYNGWLLAPASWRAVWWQLLPGSHTNTALVGSSHRQLGDHQVVQRLHLLRPLVQGTVLWCLVQRHIQLQQLQPVRCGAVQ